LILILKLSINIEVVHFGGIFMLHFKSLRTISLILIIVFLTFSCITGKNQSKNTEFGITASAVTEGIQIDFHNFPSDTTHLFIYISTLLDLEGPANSYNSVSAYAFITNGNIDEWHNSTHNLELIKKTERIIFPIVRTGRNYYISARAYNEFEYNSMRDDSYDNLPRFASTEVIADNGIYFNRNEVQLSLNNNNSVMSLISEPVFSSDIIFDEQKYSFGVTIVVNDDWTLGAGDHHYDTGLSGDGLTWTFEPQMTTVIKEHHTNLIQEGIFYTAWAEASVNIVYNDIKWTVEIAKSPEFQYSL
jgi:hypothetical protein